MLIFAKDISQRDFVHSAEDRDPDIKEYMSYQRSLFPYTIVRAGLDLAYKELDDILNYVENDNQPPADSNRQEYPSDIPGWYRTRFPWTSVFINMENMHSLLVILIKAMDSFRSHEKLNTYHLMLLYDSVHNIVELYNGLLKESQEKARDIHLSQSTPVDFDDFVNNYWPHLDFMILSQPDYEHARHLKRKQEIELAIQQRMADGEEPIKALAEASETFELDESSLHLLRRDKVPQKFLELESVPSNSKPYDLLDEEIQGDSRFGLMPLIDVEFITNMQYQKNASPTFVND